MPESPNITSMTALSGYANTRSKAGQWSKAMQTFLSCGALAEHLHATDSQASNPQSRFGRTGQKETLTPRSKRLEAQHHISAKAGGFLWVTDHSHCMSQQKICQEINSIPELQIVELMEIPLLLTHVLNTRCNYLGVTCFQGGTGKM